MGWISSSAQVLTPLKSSGSVEEVWNGVRVPVAESHAKDGFVLPRSEVLFVDQLPTVVLTESSPARGADASGMLFTLRRGDMVVTASFPTEARISSGATGTAESDDGSVMLEVRVTSPAADAPNLDDVADPDGGAAPALDAQGGSTQDLEITRVVQGELSVGQSVKVNVVSHVTSDEVLSLPVTAIATQEDGGEYVRLVRSGEVTRVPVRSGASGGGFVEVASLDEHIALRVGDVVQIT